MEYVGGKYIGMAPVLAVQIGVRAGIAGVREKMCETRSQMQSNAFSEIEIVTELS